MKWDIKFGNILDEPVDVLICSANINLNLSGGVGADLLQRYGKSLQEELHRYLANQKRHFASHGEVILTSPANVPYKAIIHVVSVDAFYKTTSEIIEKCVREALIKSVGFKAQTIALTAMGTGYGDLSLKGFANGIRPLIGMSFGAINNVSICLMEQERVDELSRYLPETAW
jgi:O-acetyl-ADP-ribose deacetylase